MYYAIRFPSWLCASGDAGQKRGLDRKKTYPNMTLKEGFSHALRDIPSNYREYFEFYNSH